MVSESTVFVEVDDNQASRTKSVKAYVDRTVKYRWLIVDLHIIPILGVTDSVVKMLDHRGTSSKVGGRVHRVNRAALGVDVRELWQSSFFEISVELAR